MKGRLFRITAVLLAESDFKTRKRHKFDEKDRQNEEAFSVKSHTAAKLPVQTYYDHARKADQTAEQFFCGEFFLTENTYCDHHFMGSWADKKSNIGKLTKIIGQQNMTRLIKLKRKLLG